MIRDVNIAPDLDPRQFIVPGLRHIEGPHRPIHASATATYPKWGFPKMGGCHKIVALVN